MQELKGTTEIGFYCIHVEKKILYELKVEQFWNSTVETLCSLVFIDSLTLSGSVVSTFSLWALLLPGFAQK